MSVGTKLIEQERSRQLNEEKYSIASDQNYQPGTLGMAAICYTSMAGCSAETRNILRASKPNYWPWQQACWKPSAGNSIPDRVRELEKAGALIAAEIDYLIVKTADGGEL